MHKRLEIICKTVCAGLAVMLITQLPGMFTEGISLSELQAPKAPERPTSSTNESNTKPVVPPPVNRRPPKPGPAGMQFRMPAGMPTMPGRPMIPGMPMGPGMPLGFPGGPGGPRAKLPPEIQAKVDFIVNGELLGPVPHPLPMALIGIAGSDVILRAPNGQTGLVNEGGELGGVKILKIGTNRVLIEHEGHQQELMLFSGYGGETLMSNEKETHK